MLPQRQRVVDYLAGYGLDAYEIPRDDAGPDGFKLRRPGADPDAVHPWPEGFSYDWLAKLVQLADAAELDKRKADPYTRKNHVID